MHESIYQNTVRELAVISRRKLIVIDYAGAALTLIGCTLLVLPLIWVRIAPACLTTGNLRQQQGGVTFPWSSPIVLAPLCLGFLVIAMFCLWEWKGARLPIVPSTSLCLPKPSVILFTTASPVYIFKHVTVTGVYIAMFVKYVTFAFVIVGTDTDSRGQ